MTNQEKTAGRVVVEALEAEGVDTIFGLPGSHINAIYVALAESPSIRHITTKHENSASLMALVYGALRHRPGVCLVTAGPGGTNALSGIAQAYTAAVPVVIITGAVAPDAAKEAFHGVDAPDLLQKAYASATKRSLTVEQVEDIPATIAQAFCLASSGRPGPVHVAIPENVMDGSTDRAPAYRKLPVEPVGLPSSAADDIAKMLRGAARPVICAGKGILAADAAAELAALAKLLGAPVVFPQDGLGAMSYKHPLCVGILTTIVGPNPFAFELMKRSDALLGIGLRPMAANLAPILRAAPRNFAFVGTDDAPNVVPEAAISCVADNKLALQELIARLKDRPRAADPALLARIEANKAAINQAFHTSILTNSRDGVVHFGLAVEELARRLREDAIVVGDIGNHGVWTVNYLPRLGVDNLVQVGTWGAMGFAVPGVTAAKLVHPERQVVGLTGDGSFLMASADFVTAVEHRLHVVYILLDDRRYGMVDLLQRREFGRSYAVDIGVPDFVKYAESFGALGIRVEEASQLGQAIDRALAADRPVIVDVVGDPLVPYVSLPEAVSQG
ncbi:MAG: thiamine pyrophosphate-binding protein [Chloroflexi bacterium]|nr:thiamine pyrophosphate-binding protein [Chloroflexota bacterium]